MAAVHGNQGRAPRNKKPVVMKAKAVRLKKEKFHDFNIAHTMDKFEEEEDLSMSYSTFYRWCTAEGLGKHKQKRRKKISKKLRERYKQEGYFIQMDGSPHVWFGEQESCLINMIDDATNKLLAAEFWPSETTMACLSVLKSFVDKHGIPWFIYTDRAGIYGGQKRQEFSHFEAACEELGIKIIYANSPEAKGRVERANRTLQDRIIPELRLAGIRDFGKANEFLQSYIENEWVKKFAVDAENPEPAFKTLPPHKSSMQICSTKFKREIKKNSTISFQGVIYCIFAKPNEPQITSNSAEVRVYPNGTWSVFVEDRLVNLNVAPKNHQPDHRYAEKIKKGNQDLMVCGQQTPLAKAS